MDDYSRGLHFNVVPSLPDVDIIEGRTFMYSACFADWSYSYSDEYDLPLIKQQPGHFIILINTYKPDQATPRHRKLMKNIAAWLTRYGYDARLFWTKRCKRINSKGSVNIVDGMPVISVAFDPSMNRAKLFHALCFARYFTYEFLGDRDLPNLSQIKTYFSFLFRRPGISTLSGHMPFKGSFIDEDVFYEFAAPRLRSALTVQSNVDKYLGPIFLNYLQDLYTVGNWNALSDETVTKADPSRSYWTGGLNYKPWKSYYDERIKRFRGQSV